MLTINMRRPEMKSQTLAILFQKGGHEAYYAIIDGRFIVPLDKKIRERYVRQLKAAGHSVVVLPDVRMVAAAKPSSKRNSRLTEDQRQALADMLSGDSVDVSPLEDLIKAG